MSDTVRPDQVRRPRFDPSQIGILDDLEALRGELRHMIDEGTRLGAEYRSHMEKALGYLLLADGRIREAERVRRARKGQLGEEAPT